LAPAATTTASSDRKKTDRNVVQTSETAPLQINGLRKHSRPSRESQANNPRAQNSLGNALFEKGKVAEAVGQFEQAVRIKPNYSDAHNNLGGAYLRLGRTQEAIARFEQALQTAPGLVEAHYNLGVALEQTGKVEYAIRQYEQALRIRPDYAEAQKCLARLRATR
jgi:tetratricopeptide (TPR) repeat protein